MSQPPMAPDPLNDQTPQPTSKNRWWMVTLRILAGTVAGLVSGGIGFWLAGLTNIPALLFVPPALMFGALLFVCIKYRRFGYVTGFILAPFLAVTALIVILLIICGGMAMKP